MLADGKIYVGTDGGKFFIVRPGADKGDDPQRGGAAEQRHQLLRLRGHAGAGAGRRGRLARPHLLRVERRGVRHRRAAGHQRRPGFAVNAPAETGAGAPAHVQVSPDRAGARRRARRCSCSARLFDDKGRFLREDKATWSLEGLKGTLADGAFTVAAEPVEQAGLIKATVGGLTGQARARVVRPLPWTETFDSYADGAAPPGWVNAVAGKISVTTLDGQKVLQKAPDETIFKRIRAFIGPTELVQLHLRGRRARGHAPPAAWATSASPRSAIRWCSTATRRG